MNLTCTMENNKLIINEYHSLSELFSTQDRKIIIPDFQRDYCWGDKIHGEKKDSDIVHGFIDTLLEEFENNKESEVLIGKIDVYENPKDHIYLTDGQQRLTTLYLLIGMLYRKLENPELKEKLKRCLISDFEENHDDQEPYLQYAVRESTIFFLRDLVNEFFIHDNQIEVSGIKKQPWYFSEYDLDPSIISMLSALSTIEKNLNNEKISDMDSFSKFIIDHVKIQYYDVIDKSHGEERFVIINTTGKSLSATENVKPILLGNIHNDEYAKDWEQRETFFWKFRKQDEDLIADNGVNDFLIWCFQIENKIENIDIIKKSKELLKSKANEPFLDATQKYFVSLKVLLEYLKDENFQKQLKFINGDKIVLTLLDLRGLSMDKLTNVLIPMLAFISKFTDDKLNSYQFLRRLRKNYFDHLWEDRKENYVDWRYVLQIIEKSSSSNECLNYEKEFQRIENLSMPRSKWYSDKEKIKEQLKEHNHSDIEEWEDHSHFMGDLSVLLDMVENKTDFKELNAYFGTYNKIQLSDFRFSENIPVKNLYRLISYLNNGHFDHRGVSSLGYCMLNKSKEKRLFLHYNFVSIWRQFNNYEEEEVIQFLYDQLRVFLNDRILKDNDLDTVCLDTRKLGHYERVQIWAILEFLNTERELNFKNSICQFWEYPNLRIIVTKSNSEKNNYEIGNLLLGTSYFNNKSGWISFAEYPLMKAFAEKRQQTTDADIKEQTQLFRNQLENLLKL